MSQLRRAFQIQLSLNLLAVVLDRFDAQMQLLRDVLGLLPTPDKLKDFHLPIAQALDR